MKAPTAENPLQSGVEVNIIQNMIINISLKPT